MRIAAALLTLFLTAYAGVTEYKLTTPSGAVVEVRNTKDYDSYELNATKMLDGSYSVRLIAKGVSASNPLKASQELNSSLIDKLLGVVR